MLKPPKMSLSVKIGTRPRIIAPGWGFYHRRPDEYSSGGTGLSLPFFHISCHWGMH